MPTAIENLKHLFTKDEKEIFSMLRAETMLAVDAFSVDKTQASKQAFFDTKSSYTRDLNCKINFTTLSVTINQLTSDTTSVKMLETSVEALPVILKELAEALAVFLKNDTNQERQESYTAALQYLDKITACFPSAEAKQDVSNDSSSYAIKK